MNDVDAEGLSVPGASAGFVAGPLGKSIGRKRDPLAVGRPCRTKISIGLSVCDMQIGADCELVCLLGNDVENPDARLVNPDSFECLVCLIFHA